MEQTLEVKPENSLRLRSHSVVLMPRDSRFDPGGRRVAREAQEFGLGDLHCASCRLFFLQGEFTAERLQELTSKLLLDAVVEEVCTETPSDVSHTIDVALLPGVTDTEAESLLKAAQKLGFTELTKAARATRYHFRSSSALEKARLEEFAASRLANEVIENFRVDTPIAAPFITNVEKAKTPEAIQLTTLSSEQLEELSVSLKLALDKTEMEAIREHYRTLDREPTRCELETFAQTWSEHCVHKTFRARIDYLEEGKQQTLDGLLPILRKTTEELNLDWIVSAFVDNAGIVKFHEDWDIAIKAETHNHPSALEPFGGANTGVGGVIRDILGVSARPFANWDVLCFGPLTSEAPQGSLPPRQVMTGVVHGIADYGNKMGIPTVAGGVYFHEGYLANPLVYAGCLGILPRGPRPTEVKNGDRIVLIGGKTGRDGLGGATFSSLEMDTDTAQECGTAVQIGHPIAEKVASELVLEACAAGLYNAVTDCGAGGLASAIGEMGDELGALVHLERVPTKYPGLSPRELWLSEAQERMVLAVPQEKLPSLLEMAKKYDTVCVDLGHFGNDGRLQLHYEGQEFADLAIEILHGGIPRRELKAEWSTPEIEEKPVNVDPGEALLKLLADPNICSREPVLRHYDFEVQGGTTIKPLTPLSGPSDGTALVPYEIQDEEDPKAVALGCGLNPWLTELDPRLGTLGAIDEAIRNVVAAGADPSRIALLDNFSWGNPKLPDRLGKLCRSVLACAEGSKLYRAPFVSGKDSLNNEFKQKDGTRRAIPGTILISAVGFLPAASLRVPSNFQNVGDQIYLLGPEQDALGGSAYLRAFDGSSPDLSQPYEQAAEMYEAFHKAVQNRLVASCHDLSEGGLAVALAESCLGLGYGAEVATQESLFAEGPSRLLISVSAKNENALVEALKDFPLRKLGVVSEEKTLKVEDHFTHTLQELRKAFQGHVFDSLTEEFKPTGSFAQRTYPQVPPTLMKQPKVGVLFAPGINRERDMMRAVEVAGGRAELIIPDKNFDPNSYGMLVLPGGFSYGDDLGAGRIWALGLEELQEKLRTYSAAGGAIFGVCNGFQTLLKSGLLLDDYEHATLTHNDSDHFECRWVDLEICSNSDSIFTAGLEGYIRCPIAHGEGRLVATADQARSFRASGRTPLLYSSDSYPENPNGSVENLASLCNRAGNVMGMMPHPENNVLPWQAAPGDPAPCSGLALIRNALRNLK